MRKKREDETQEQTKERKDKDIEYRKNKNENETPKDRRERLDREAANKRDKRAKEYQEQRVFSYVRELCFDFVPMASTKKFYTSKGGTGSDWAIKYHNVITLIQKKVAPQQRDEEKNVISHAIYNYIMEKL